MLDDLEGARQLAELTSLPVPADLGGYPVTVQPHSFGKYRYCLKHDLGMLGFTPSRKLPPIRYQASAVALHAAGPEGAVLWLRNLLDSAGIDATLHVSRLDLHSDWQRLDMKASERANFVTYSNLRALYEVDEQLAGLNFGKRGAPIYCRIYDKSREAEKNGHDWWPEVWGPAYDPDEKVLRIEFELRREGLKQFGVDTPDEAISRAGELWAYVTQSWLSLRQPSADETRSRWPVDPRWQAVQRATLAGGCAPAARIREGERQGQLRTYRKLATGVLSSMAVPMGTHDVDDTLDALVPELRLYEQVSGQAFGDRVATKRQRGA
ncbi:MAG: hypothetical protein KDB40_18795 [Acidimicrobiales bacterium]|nr:hypothetical protein [Acidimicrobiales bacterium]